MRAALAIQRALADLNARNARSGAPELSAPHRHRVWLCRGRMRLRWKWFGEAYPTWRRAGRQVAAEPGTVLVTAERTASDGRAFRRRGQRRAYSRRGVAQPVTLYRIVRASGGGRRRRGARPDANRRPRGRTCVAALAAGRACWKAKASSSRLSARPASESRV